MAHQAKVPRSRGRRHYDKPPLDLDDLVTRLVDRGLDVSEPTRARRYLQHLGYYRLSPYTIPFQQGGGDVFREGTTFDDILDLYVFDRALRLLIMDALERVEVAVRAALTDHMSTTYNDPHWYVDSGHFSNRRMHDEFLKIVRDLCRRRLAATPEASEGTLMHRSALEHYLMTYGSPELPPSWVMVEMLTIGQLSSMYRNLKVRADRTAVARSLGLNTPLLESWLSTYVRVRNICAHHGRMWNVGLGVYPAIPNSSSVPWLREEIPERSRIRLYPVLVSLQSVLNEVSPHSGWSQRLHELLSRRPEMNLAGMGVPRKWSEDEFWRRHLD